ncbi:MAG TPA: hypothetical protein RMH99_17880, partial [Sandaracinaceae bacterium LLY-WYZ-13_1]|nr:hypothetical protein [Sandaracinaceae bacterium LLY-WYZ-13_1]
MDDTRFEPTTPDAARDSGLFDAWQMLADHHAGRIPDYPPPEPVALDRRAPSRAPWILAGAAVFFAFGATALAMTAITTARSAERDPARPDAPKVALARVNPPDAPVETAAPEHTPQPPIETTEDGATEAATDAPRPTPRPATRARRDPTPTPVAAEPEPQRTPAHSWQTGGGGGPPLDVDLDSLLDRALG